MSIPPSDVVLVLGTRPEIIKLAPLAIALRRQSVDVSVLHTGQHYDDELSGRFLRLFSLDVDTQLAAGGGGRAEQIARMLGECADQWTRRRCGAVVVQGDTNTALAGALAANSLEIPLIHVEAGLRSNDRAMPEEHNRRMIDHVADLLCAPTELSAAALRDERVTGDIAVTGNTEVDAVRSLLPRPADCAALARSFGVEPGAFVLSTIHRPENTDDPMVLSTLLDGLRSAGAPVVLPLHPRTRNAIERAGVSTAGLVLTEPFDARTMWALLSCCRLAVSDSGGVQEDVSITCTPLLVPRRSTERPEVCGTFARLVDPRHDFAEVVRTAVAEAGDWKATLRSLPTPYAAPDGGSPAEYIAALIAARLVPHSSPPAVAPLLVAPLAIAR